MIARRTYRLALMHSSSLLFWLFLLHTAHADLIPPERLVDWTPGVRTGVIGGIPTTRTHIIDVTQAPYNADNTGATNASPAIQAAINAAVAKDIVYLPAGRYRIDTGLSISASKDSITIRGAGPGATIIDCRANAGISVGVGTGFRPPFRSTRADCVISDGLTKGSTTVTIVDTTHFTVGNIMQVSPANDPGIPVFSDYGYDLNSINQPMQRQLVRLVSKTATRLTFSPPLYRDYSGINVEMWSTDYQSDFVGLEDFAIDGTNGSVFAGIWFLLCHGSWVKNVTSSHINNYPIYFQNCLNCEIRHSYIGPGKQGGSNGAALLLNAVSACLFEDNILIGTQPLLEVSYGSSGNVFAYNFGVQPINGLALDTNHGPHNSFNLYEGNIAADVIADGYFGSCSDDTFFRNWLNAVDSGYAVSLKRFTRRYSFVGNILAGPIICGQPNIGNGSYSGKAQLSRGHPWNDWRATGTLTTRISNTQGVVTLYSGSVTPGQLVVIRWSTPGYRLFRAGTVAGNTVIITGGGADNGNNLPAEGTALNVFMGPGGYQELDLNVEATLIKKGNRYTADNSFDSLGGDTLPTSLFRTAKPSYFGSLTWPPFNPLISNGTFAYDQIPAGYRYVHGADPLTPSPKSGVTLESQGINLPPQEGPSATPELQRINLPSHDGPSATPESQQKLQKKWTKSKKAKKQTGTITKNTSVNEMSETPRPSQP